MTEPAPANPYVVAGCEDDPGQPLCPWAKDCAHHEAYYCPAGGHDDAYEHFVTRLPDPSQLSTAGRLVVVSGPSLSGKTSLVNRSVAWVRTGLAERSLSLRICDLRGACPRKKAVEQRAVIIANRLILELKGQMTSGWIHDAIKENPQDVNQVIPLFGKIHEQPRESGGGTFFAILLPSLETDTAEDEIDLYSAALAGCAGVICLTEYSADSPAREDRGQSPVIRLGLRYVRPADSYALVQHWPDRPLNPSPTLPEVRETELVDLVTFMTRKKMNVTTGTLLATLRAIYESRIRGTSRYGTLDYVEYREVLEAYIDLVLPDGQGTP